VVAGKLLWLGSSASRLVIENGVTISGMVVSVVASSSVLIRECLSQTFNGPRYTPGITSGDSTACNAFPDR